MDKEILKFIRGFPIMGFIRKLNKFLGANQKERIATEKLFSKPLVYGWVEIK